MTTTLSQNSPHHTHIYISSKVFQECCIMYAKYYDEALKLIMKVSGLPLPLKKKKKILSVF